MKIRICFLLEIPNWRILHPWSGKGPNIVYHHLPQCLKITKNISFEFCQNWLQLQFCFGFGSKSGKGKNSWGSYIIIRHSVWKSPKISHLKFCLNCFGQTCIVNSWKFKKYIIYYQYPQYLKIQQKSLLLQYLFLH